MAVFQLHFEFMNYIKGKWIHDFLDEPIWLYCELDDSRFETRKIEVFRDGRYAFADDVTSHGTELSYVEIPSLSSINEDPQFDTVEITAEEFELVWETAHAQEFDCGATRRTVAPKIITYLKGDATAPKFGGNQIIAHICNDLGAWGKGFVLAVSVRWSQPEKEFREWHRCRSQKDFGLGAVQLVQVGQSIWVANMIGQHGIKSGTNGAPPIRYDALEQCLSRLAELALELNASVHMPRIGCGLAGGKWESVEPLIANRLCKQGITVCVYDFN